MQGNRNLADFFNVTIDSSGAAEIVYDDMSNGLIQAGNSNPADHAGAAVVTVIRQNGGPGLYGPNVTGPSAKPVAGLKDVAGDALYPVIGGTNLPAMDVIDNTLGLSGTTLTVTMRVADLTQLAAAGQATKGVLQEYVTRWQMGNKLYYAEMYASNSLSTAQFSAGTVQSVDLCSVSACDHHVLLYPEQGVTAE